jgi:hypothetical protein
MAIVLSYLVHGYFSILTKFCWQFAETNGWAKTYIASLNSIIVMVFYEHLLL